MFVKFLSLFLLASSVLATPLQARKFQLRPRIINGVEAKRSQFPYMVSLREFSGIPIPEYFKHFCGGAIISDFWVLSASHCFTGSRSKYISNLSYMRLVVGTNKIRGDGDVYDVNRIIKHENHNDTSRENDIALVQTFIRLFFSENVHAIAISKQEVEPEQIGVFFGFGSILSGTNFTKPEHLLTTKFRVISNDECFSLYNPKNHKYIHNSTLCAYNKNSRAGFGDSGGPLVIANRLVGICSTSTPRKGGFPTQFMRLSEFTVWIRHITGITAL